MFKIYDKYMSSLKLLLNKRLLQTVDHQRIHFKLLTILKLEKGENI